jgi:hypothetical protein
MKEENKLRVLVPKNGYEKKGSVTGTGSASTSLACNDQR